MENPMPAAKLPTLFLSHGAPNLVLHETPAHQFLKAYGQDLITRFGKPKAIVIATAHFETATPMLTADAKPAMIYDFGGFEKELYSYQYPAPGAPEVANEALTLLSAAGYKASAVTDRGYDHGTWVPLALLFPEADIPVVQLSVQPQAGAAHHMALGAALAPLRDKGVLIIGSGSATHNLHEFFRGGYAEDAPVPDWVSAFGEWVHARIEAGDSAAIANYRTIAPKARENHPSEEHFLPLPFAMGAAMGTEKGADSHDGANVKGRRVHSSHQYGVLMMDAYEFG